QPNTASHTMRKRDSSSVQISGSPNERVTTPSDTQPSSAATSAQATRAATLSKAPTRRRSIGLTGAAERSQQPRTRSRRGDALPEPLAPLPLELGGEAGQNRLAEALDVGLDDGHAAGLEGIDELRFLRQDLVVLNQRVGIDRCLERLPFLAAK